MKCYILGRLLLLPAKWVTIYIPSFLFFMKPIEITKYRKYHVYSVKVVCTIS